MPLLDRLSDTPLTRLLSAVNPEVFTKPAQAFGIRDLQRDMSGILSKLRSGKDYAILTNRGAPAFLIIPFDQGSWSSLLAVAPPAIHYEIEKAHRTEEKGETLPDTDEVLKSAERLTETSKTPRSREP